MDSFPMAKLIDGADGEAGAFGQAHVIARGLGSSQLNWLRSNVGSSTVPKICRHH